MIRGMLRETYSHIGGDPDAGGVEVSSTLTIDVVME